MAIIGWSGWISLVLIFFTAVLIFQEQFEIATISILVAIYYLLEDRLPKNE